MFAQHHEVQARASCIDAQTNMGFTPLHLAAQEGAEGPRIIRILLEQGANPTISDVDGRNAYHHAMEKGRDDCADVLTSNLPTKGEITQNRFYLERDYKVQPTKERMQRNPRLEGFKLPDRMPVLPRFVVLHMHGCSAGI